MFTLSHMKKAVVSFFAMSALCLAMTSQAQAVSVDTELQLLVDVSGSVSSSEFSLQRDGYINAFNSTAVQNAIAGGTHGAIAVQLIYWAGSSSQSAAVDWMLINDATSAANFSTLLSGVARPFGGLTAPGSAINFGVPLFNNNFEGTKLVIDVSGDGAQNNGASTSAARNAALLAGIDQINGLPILGQSGLEAWYNNNIKGGTNAFVLPAANFSSFQAAIEQKLVTEITGTETPEPSTMILLGSGLMGLVAWRMKKQA